MSFQMIPKIRIALFVLFHYAVITSPCWSSETTAEMLDQKDMVFRGRWNERLSKSIEELKLANSPAPVLMVYRQSEVADDEDCLILVVPVFEVEGDPFTKRGKPRLHVYFRHFGREEARPMEEVGIEGDAVYQLWKVASDICWLVASGRSGDNQRSGDLVSGFSYRVLATHFDGKAETFTPHMGAMIASSGRGEKDEAFIKLFEGFTGMGLGQTK